jgi:hypothetical protein
LLAHGLSAGSEFGVAGRLACGVVWAVVAFALAVAASPALRRVVLQRFCSVAYRML